MHNYNASIAYPGAKRNRIPVGCGVCRAEIMRHLAGGGYGDGGCLGDLILVLKVVLHGLLFALNIGFQCSLHSVGLALGGLHDGYGVAAHHHGGNRGGKALVAAVLKAQQGEHDVFQLVVQLVGLVLGAVAVDGGELAVLAFGEDHIVFVFLVGAGIVEDLGIILRGGGVGLAAGGAAHKGKQGQPRQQGGDESFHSRVVLSYPVLRVAELRRSARLVCAVLRLVYHIRTRRAEDCRKMVTVL